MLSFMMTERRWIYSRSSAPTTFSNLPFSLLAVEKLLLLLYELSWFNRRCHDWSVHQQTRLIPTSFGPPTPPLPLPPLSNPSASSLFYRCHQHFCYCFACNISVHPTLPPTCVVLMVGTPFRPFQGRSGAFALEWRQMMEALSATVTARVLFFSYKKRQKSPPPFPTPSSSPRSTSKAPRLLLP